MSFILQKIHSNDSIAHKEPLPNFSSQLFKNKSKPIVNAKKSSLIEWKCILFGFLLSFANIGIILCVILKTFEENQDQALFEDLCVLFAGSSVIFSIMKNINKVHLNRLIYSNQNVKLYEIFSIGSIVLFYCLHPNPLLQNISFSFNGSQYEVNSILSSIVHFRVVSIIVYCLQICRYYGLRITRILQIYAVKDRVNVIYTIKCLLKNNGLKSPFVMMILSVAIIPFILKSIYSMKDINTDYLSVLYETVITMTTVGYGDILHQDGLSEQIIVIIVMIIGSLTSSLLTLTALNFFTLNQQQSKAYVTIKRLSLIEEIENEKKRVAVQFFRIHKQIKNRKNQNKAQSRSNLMNNIDYKSLIAPSIRENQKILQQYKINQSFKQINQQNYKNIATNIKIIVQKQLISHELINFYLMRKQISYNIQGQEHKSAKPNINKNRRVDDSIAMGAIKRKILFKEDSNLAL